MNEISLYPPYSLLSPRPRPTGPIPPRLGCNKHCTSPLHNAPLLAYAILNKPTERGDIAYADYLLFPHLGESLQPSFVFTTKRLDQRQEHGWMARKLNAHTDSSLP